MRILRGVLGVAVGVWLLVVAVLFFGQRRLLYPRPAPAALPPVGERFDVVIPGGSVPVLRALVPGRPTVAWFHGNAEQLARAPIGVVLQRNLGFLGIEYPGYGLATGAGPTEEGIFAAARAGLGTAGFVVCVGRSLGTGVAAAMAAEGRCERLVLVSPYTSITDVARRDWPWLPVGVLLLDRFDTWSRAGDIRVPTLVIHGRRDATIPVSMGREVAEAISGARLVETDHGHNDILDASTWDLIAAFAG